ncbi:MAG: CheB methylesterase domain-containing protein [Clostridia bacterium]|nr:CheB methylesterase domain-containing protein [Clostridia bacterium]
MRPDIVLIATSTGGPDALKKITPNLDKNLGVPVIVVQHMLEGYTKQLALGLDRISNIPVKEVEYNEKLEKSKVYVAKAGVHMKLSNPTSSIFPRVTFNDGPKVNHVKPAADVLFKNVADEYKKKNVLVVVGTGMGKDGLEGLMELKKTCNVYCITEAEEDCVVYGMPKVINDAGLSNEVCKVDRISYRINDLCKKGWNNGKK